MCTMYTFKTHETSNSLKEHQRRHIYVAWNLQEEALTQTAGKFSTKIFSTTVTKIAENSTSFTTQAS
uniref:Uncharacterized protein n=1 Tax=Solanum tuberosum TaxID=4113 RepID=M1CIQ6_SOLTU